MGSRKAVNAQDDSEGLSNDSREAFFRSLYSLVPADELIPASDDISAFRWALAPSPLATTRIGN
jgi:hypothetical protein